MAKTKTVIDASPKAPETSLAIDEKEAKEKAIWDTYAKQNPVKFASKVAEMEKIAGSGATAPELKAELTRKLGVIKGN